MHERVCHIDVWSVQFTPFAAILIPFRKYLCNNKWILCVWVRVCDYSLPHTIKHWKKKQPSGAQNIRVPEFEVDGDRRLIAPPAWHRRCAGINNATLSFVCCAHTPCSVGPVESPNVNFSHHPLPVTAFDASIVRGGVRGSHIQHVTIRQIVECVRAPTNEWSQ